MAASEGRAPVTPPTLISRDPQPERLVCVNGELLPASDLRFPSGEMGWMRGYGVFETLYLHPGGCFAVDPHLRRLEDSARLLRIPTPPREDLVAALQHWISACGMRRGRVRILLILDGTHPWWMIDGQPLPARPPLEERGLKMLVSHLTVPPAPLGSAKTISRVSYELAGIEARDAGLDDAILATVRGQLGESTRANVFWAREGHLHTPPVSLGILPGVTRNLLVEEFARHGVHVDEHEAPLEVLWDAEEVFVCSTVRGVAPVVELRDPAGRQRVLTTGQFTRRAEEIMLGLVHQAGLEDGS